MALLTTDLAGKTQGSKYEHQAAGATRDRHTMPDAEPFGGFRLKPGDQIGVGDQSVPIAGLICVRDV